MPNELKTDYKSDQLMPSQNGKRTFNIVDSDGNIVLENVHIEDKSDYLQVGDEYGSEVINEQNTIINALMKGAYMAYDTYQQYSDAYDNNEIPVGALVIIKSLTNDNLTALQVGYNNSNVKAALDSHGNSISQINSDLNGLKFNVTDLGTQFTVTSQGEWIYAPNAVMIQPTDLIELRIYPNTANGKGGFSTIVTGAQLGDTNSPVVISGGVDDPDTIYVAYTGANTFGVFVGANIDSKYNYFAANVITIR